MNVPAPIAALVDELEQVCGDDDPSLGWTEETLAVYLAESALELDYENPAELVGWVRRSVAYYLWWAKGRVL